MEYKNLKRNYTENQNVDPSSKGAQTPDEQILINKNLAMLYKRRKTLIFQPSQDDYSQRNNYQNEQQEFSLTETSQNNSLSNNNEEFIIRDSDSNPNSSEEEGENAFEDNEETNENLQH